MPTDDPSDTSPKPWVAHGSCAATHEDFLIGNRAGLDLLKRKIDDAIATGECKVDEGGVEFVGIRVVELDPRAETSARTGGFKNAMRLLGCGLLGFALILVLLAGLFQIWNWMK
jgi:hypothetical protein